uniref:Uncharacterized protein n=1 Tax=Solanum lycopersicum TaxID=4081 RepID=A0A3Q7FFY4_SOLLC
MIVVAIEPTLDKTLFARASFNSVDEEDMLLRDFFASPCVRTSFFPLKNEQSMQENSDNMNMELGFDHTYEGIETYDSPPEMKNLQIAPRVTKSKRSCSKPVALTPKASHALTIVIFVHFDVSTTVGLSITCGLGLPSYHVNGKASLIAIEGKSLSLCVSSYDTRFEVPTSSFDFPFSRRVAFPARRTTVCRSSKTVRSKPQSSLSSSMDLISLRLALSQPLKTTIQELAFVPSRTTHKLLPYMPPVLIMVNGCDFKSCSNLPPAHKPFLDDLCIWTSVEWVSLT